MKKQVAMTRWSDLVNDELEQITGLLPLPDYHWFSAVCKNWRFVEKKKWHSPALQLPWLVLGEDEETRKCKFYSLSENKHYSIDIPELNGRFICGSSHGWLIAIDINITYILIDPFTWEFYELPPFPSYNDNVDESRNYTFEEMQLLIVCKAILSHDPKVRSDFTAMILYGELNSLTIWRPGDSTWMAIKRPNYTMADVTYLDGNFYLDSALKTRLYVVDLWSDPEMIEIKPPGTIVPRVSMHKYLVNFKGYLLYIDRYQKLIGERLSLMSLRWWN